EGGAPAQAGTRFSVHDVVLDDISRSYTGLGWLFFVANSWPTNPVNTITINHVTGFPDAGSGFLLTGNQSPNPNMYGFVLTNSIVTSGQSPVWSMGGGRTSCAFGDVPVTTLNQCFGKYTFEANALVAPPAHYPPPSWPKGAMFPPSPNNVGFVEYNNGNGGNYELQPTSPYKNAGTDGKDLGADIVGLNQLLANVE
ncbi:MAG: hypothetical protein ABSD75_33105, partial [Terriglobales bacterium]